MSAGKTWWYSAAAMAVLCGCAQNPMVMEGRLEDVRRENQGLAVRSDDDRRRAQLLDGDNQSLQAMLAQSQQQTRIYEDQVRALQQQLKGSSEQMAKLRQEREALDARGGGSVAGGGPRPKATITNSSLKQGAPKFDIPGVEVRYDGDVLRIELPGRSLFEQGGARLQPGAERILDEVAGELSRSYPDQIIGVEGHTDNEPVLKSPHWQNNHQLSVARAMTVYDHLTTRSRIRAGQLSVVGHGSNHPVVSNATPAGKERNRRVELVIYPETLPR